MSFKTCFDLSKLNSSQNIQFILKPFTKQQQNVFYHSAAKSADTDN